MFASRLVVGQVHHVSVSVWLAESFLIVVDKRANTTAAVNWL